ncbi:unnamed protein product [Cochlearia groenlandica]
MEGSSSGSRKRKRAIEEETRLGTLSLDVLDCLICRQPLTIPIFQLFCFVFHCENGHICCSCCCPKLNNKCPLCAYPIDNKRCRAMENVLESIIVPCRYANLGCTEKVSYVRETNHEKYCKFSLCACPKFDECKYKAYNYDDIYFHYITLHLLETSTFFALGESRNVEMHIEDKVLVVTTLEKKILFLVQCFKESDGIYVTVNCIAPMSPEVEKFSYRISYSSHGHTHSHESSEMKRILEVSFERPNEGNFMFVPNKLLHSEVLEMELCISEA